MFIKLNFLRDFRVQDCNTGATVIQKHVLIIVKDTFGHRQINMFPVQVLMLVLTVTCFQDEVNLVTQRVQQFQKEVKKFFF